MSVNLNFQLLRHYLRVIEWKIVKPRLWRLIYMRLSDFNFTTLPRPVFPDFKKKREELLKIRSKDEILNQAHEADLHRFAFFSENLLDFGEIINWNKDYKTGYEWQKKQYNEISYAATPLGNDIKFPWEVSRFHWLAWFGEAFLVSGENRWAESFQREISDWIDENPLNIGVNWAMPMEVSIRALNWLLAYSFFKDADCISDEFWQKFLNSLWQHAQFLSFHLEYARHPGNHLLADCLGLLALGKFFAKNRWFVLSQKILEQEMLREVYSDGVNYEKSTSYHRLTAEIFLIAAQITENFNQSFSEKYKVRLEKMFEFIAAYSRPDGSAPMFGDADNGRIFRFRADEDFNNQSQILSAGARFFGRSDFENHPFNSPPYQGGVSEGRGGSDESPALSEDALFLMKQITKSNIARPTSPQPYPKEREQKKSSPLGEDLGEVLQSTSHFAKGGFVIHQSERHHLFVDVGDYGMDGWGGHGHNDCLAFEFWANGVLIFTDSGTGVYTADREKRNALRSTKAHNTVEINSAEQAEFSALWRVKKDETAPKVLSIKDDERNFELIAEHSGYVSRFGTKHRRTFSLNLLENECGRLEITDEIFDFVQNQAISYFHFAPNAKIIKQTDRKVVLNIGNQEISCVSGENIEISEQEMSTMYGVFCKHIVLKMKSGNFKMSW